MTTYRGPDDSAGSGSSVTALLAQTQASAAEAAASEANAAVSEANAATSEANSATSETNAASSAASALAAYDSFDDRYLGAKASDPALDNDGNALITGALYFNTTTGRMMAYNGSSWFAATVNGIDSSATATAITITSSGDVGIGVVPEAWNTVFDVLQVGGLGSIFATASQAAGSATDIGSNVYYDGAWKYIVTDEASRYRQDSGTHQFYTTASGTADTAITWSERMRIDNNGNLGIGVAPSTKLHIGAGGVIRLNRSDNARYGELYTDNTGTFLTSDATNSDPLYLVSNGSSGQLRFNTNGTERMRIDNSGNVGIGTTPSYKLDVSGDTQLTGTLRFTGTATQRTSGNVFLQATGSEIKVGPGGSGIVTFHNSGVMTVGDETMRIDASGNVGMGVAPSYPLHVVGSSNTYFARFDNTNANPYGLHVRFSGASPDNNTNHFLDCSDSTTTRLKIFSDGDVVNHDGTYGTISDGRLKQDIVTASSQWEDIKAIGAIGKKYRHIKDVANKGEAAKVMLGWVAQDVEAISPGLVMHTQEEVGRDVDDNPVYEETLGIRSSILFTKNVMATSEALQRIEALEAALADLQSKIKVATVPTPEAP